MCSSDLYKPRQKPSEHCVTELRRCRIVSARRPRYKAYRGHTGSTSKVNMLALRATRIVTRQAKQCRTFMALSEEHDQIRDVARGFAEERLMPIAGETDRLHKFPREAVTDLAELGFMGMMVDDADGGGGMDAVSYAVALEEVSRGCARRASSCRPTTRCTAHPSPQTSRRTRRTRF